jgi:two-component system LytT family sensor kinase
MNKNCCDTEPNDFWFRVIGIPATGILGGFTSLIQTPEISLPVLILNSLLITGIIWEANRWMVIRMRNRFPSYEQTVKRIAAQFTLSIVGSSLILIAYCNVFGLLFVNGGPNTTALITNLITGLTFTILISIIYECVYFFSMWKQSIVESEELKRQQVLSQYEALKSQVNPHFLFNSLNTLTGLIEDDQSKAVEYVHQLSKVYRHILQSSDKETISLREEMNFLKSYIFLLKMRFGENLITEISIDDHLQDALVPALAVQQLVENAIKHNIISTSQPLHLKVSTDSSGRLTVVNNLQKKMSVEHSSGFGLSSLQHRFHLLGADAVNVVETESQFRVTIPLLSQ